MGVINPTAGYLNRRPIEQTADYLSRLLAESTTFRNDYQFLMAGYYCHAYRAMAEQMVDEGEKSPTPQKINRRLRAVPGYCGPGPSFLSDAKRVYDTFRDVFDYSGDQKKCYDAYRRIAVAAIPDEVRHQLRAELEAGATQAEIRRKIREVSDACRQRQPSKSRLSNQGEVAPHEEPHATARESHLAKAYARRQMKPKIEGAYQQLLSTVNDIELEIEYLEEALCDAGMPEAACELDAVKEEAQRFALLVERLISQVSGETSARKTPTERQTR